MTSQQNILNRIKRIVTHLGSCPHEPGDKVYLYGSRARGNMKPDSDWDLLILVKDAMSFSEAPLHIGKKNQFPVR